MIRILCIGREADAEGSRLRELVGDEVEVETARLPAEGIRRIEDLLPDAVIVFGPRSAARLGNLVEGIRSRAVGALAPLVLVSPERPPADVAARCDAIFEAAASPEELLREVARVLEIEAVELLGAASPAAQASVGAEPIAPRDARRERREKRASAPSRVETALEPPTEDEVDRKWRQIRHENYFVVMGLDPGAEVAVIRAAVENLRRRFSKTEVPPELSAARSRELTDIREALDEAATVLLTDALRDAYTSGIHH